MKRSKNLRTVIIAIALLATAAGFSLADTATVSNDVRIKITPITMLEVKNAWKTTGVITTESGWTIASASTSYGVTSTVPTAVIQVTLIEELPEGVILKVRMQSGIGASHGWVELRGGLSVNLVSSVRGAEYNVAEMELIVPEGVSIDTVPIWIAYTIS